VTYFSRFFISVVGVGQVYFWSQFAEVFGVEHKTKIMVANLFSVYGVLQMRIFSCENID
jgi:hypothetical protein